ncbi:MAG TPA: TadE/TadG family type IV pilus assembly protein [Hyphomicrobium sp.]|nr:TadE/TadG family type IV pilus assembly protein [Hyphomicrobium sp.]
MRNIRRPRSSGCASSVPFVRNEDGSTAIEFGLIALPFMLLLLAIVGMGLYFLATVSLEHGAEAAARKIRTGQVENDAVTVAQFRSLVCQSAGVAIDCSKLSVIVQSKKSWSELTPEPCLDKENNMTESTGKPTEAISKYSGAASEVVLVTLCYRWDLADRFKFLKLGSGTNGTGPAIIQAATAFKSEPYN